MKSKRVMTKEDKRRYFKYHSRREPAKWIALIFLVISLIIFFVAGKDTIFPKDEHYTQITSGFFLCLGLSAAAAVYSIAMHCIFLTIFFQKKEVVEGHVYKVHRERMYANDSDKSVMATKAKAISEDGNIATPWQHCPKKFKNEINKPVLILIHKGQPVEFFY